MPEAIGSSSSRLLRALDNITKLPALSLFTLLYFAVMALIGVHQFATRTEPPFSADGSGTGDFDAFWTGARLIADGRGPDLYDLGAQRQLQEQVLGNAGDWIPYVNPPGLAVALHPLAKLGFLPAYWGFAAAQVVLLTVALWLLRPRVPQLGRTSVGYATVCLMIAGYPPVLRSMLGHQNSALTLALLMFLYVGLREGRGVAAGVVLGLLSYKPQFALVIGAALLAQRAWVPILVASGVAAVHWSVGAWFCGLDWPLAMSSALAEFRPMAHSGMGFSQISVPGAFGWMGVPVLGWVVALAILVWTLGRTIRIRPADPAFPLAFSAWIVATLLTSPHAQFYDMGVALLPVVLLIDDYLAREPRLPLSYRLVLAGAYLSFPVYQVAELLGIQPLLVVLIALAAWSAVSLRRLPQLETESLSP